MNMRTMTLSLSTALLILVGSAGTTLASSSDTADTDVVIEDSGGTLDVAITSDAEFLTNDTLPVRPQYSLLDQSVYGDLAITVSDSRGTAAGWHVNLSASDFSCPDCASSLQSQTIAISNLSLIKDTIEVGATGSYYGLGGVSGADLIPVSSTGQLVFQSTTNNGMGTFTLPMHGTLTIPGGTIQGTYTSTITVEIASGA